MDKCRLCYTDPNPQMCQHIFNSKFKPPIWKIIKQISNLRITKNDPYTKTICGPCFTKLIDYSAFRSTILDTNYRVQHAEELLSKKISDNCDYFEVHCTPTSSNCDVSIVKEEQIEIEEHDPLEIDNEIKEEFNNSSVAVIDNQNIKELTIEDGINNIDKIPACYTSPDDNSIETNERQSNKCSTDDEIDFSRGSTETDGSCTISASDNDLRLTNNDDIITNDGNEISIAKDIVGSSKNFDDDSSCTNFNKDINVKKEEFNLEIISNNRTVCDKQLSQKTYLRINKRIRTGDKPFTCTICNKQFLHKTKLLLHERVHTGEKPFGCNICKKQFSQKGTLLSHQRTHTGEKPFKCNICNKQFSQKAGLLRHQQVHTDEKPFKCNICKKQFSCKTNLLLHERVHTSEKPFKCNICKKEFSRKAYLRIHKRIHTGEKPFKCYICNKQFTRRASLQNHEPVHTGTFKCTICNKEFSSKTNLYKHERVHTGEKPFKCNICDKSFSSREHLREHSNIHTGQKPYCCNICNKMFSFRSALCRHLKAHRNEK